jgi:hypothetical protein
MLGAKIERSKLGRIYLQLAGDSNASALYVTQRVRNPYTSKQGDR